jgi:prepilin signal peptidase PulO-like enzyme (type II secretory pathway)
MLAAMAEGNLIIEHPNRDTPASQATRALVVALLLVSTAILVIATVGGWEKIQGAKPVHVAYVLVYLLLAFFIARWRSGLLPVAASFAIILLIFCAISGPQWFSRDKPGFEDPLLSASIVGTLVLFLVPLQLLLIAAAARGFSQKWSVEVERRAGGGTQPYVAQPG